MKIRIGIVHSAREHELDVDLSIDDIAKEVTKAAVNGTPLILTDSKGRSLLIPSAHLAYIQHSDDEPRRVGFLG